MKDKYRLILDIEATVYAYGEESARMIVQSKLKELFKDLEIIYEYVKIRVKQK